MKALTILLIVVTGISAWAQDAAPTPTNEERAAGAKAEIAAKQAADAKALVDALAAKRVADFKAKLSAKEAADAQAAADALGSKGQQQSAQTTPQSTSAPAVSSAAVRQSIAAKRSRLSLEIMTLNGKTRDLEQRIKDNHSNLERTAAGHYAKHNHWVSGSTGDANQLRKEGENLQKTLDDTKSKITSLQAEIDGLAQ
jgi:Na+-transporting methylmalonyl-CoA/oxaloacetate decarboxylase gamma subunit/chaperonin cofactor prefoldin